VVPLAREVERADAYARAVDEADGIRDALAADGRRVLAAVSGTCREPGEYAAGLADACHVLERVRRERERDAGAPGTGAAERLGVGRLFLSPEQRSDVRRFAEDVLGPLLAPDERGRVLLGTLRAWFAAAGNTKAAADALGVHANTVRYRLANVREATGLDVVLSPTDQLAAHLAISVLDDRAAGPAAGPRGG
ncbi:PucR family transcriptional regulator, partial [Patulibacter sp. S7RM1-6]